MKKLPRSFYLREDVLQVARELLGKIVVTKFGGLVTSARIVETEAYAGVTDRASHAFGARRTARNEPMYAGGGIAYIYLCYGIHHLFNVVTNVKEIPHAILVRAGEPVSGIDTMLKRTGKKMADNTLTRGPGNFSKALGLHTAQSGMSLSAPELYIAGDSGDYEPLRIGSSPRIGVGYAGKDALLPYRFYVKGNPYVSSQPR